MPKLRVTSGYSLVWPIGGTSTETGRQKRGQGCVFSCSPSPACSDSGSSGPGTVDVAPVSPLSSMSQAPVPLSPLFLLSHVSRLVHILFNCKSIITCLLISWLQSPSAVILEPKKVVCYCFHCFPIYLP